MGFMMATFYLVHWPDDDIQEITWEIISSTTSIFGALLLFQGCNRVVNYYFLDHVAAWHQLAVNMLHMMLWFCVLQLVLAYYSGAVGQQQVPAKRRSWQMEKEDEYEVIWGECVAETEDEVISLSVSFLIAQVFPAFEAEELLLVLMCSSLTL
ncbi:unnamed protein product [Symbiodinium pilosum]|uniref:Uncharacterized protein n=1 Tax=Symbiodinium pilosum TaxID=2952 RepID=A0A812SBS6_SYMPI|nr:unnamed protein product [Symbiodinium pilosum]